MDEGPGRYSMGGHVAPSEHFPADTGGVNMRPPGALPFNPTPRGNVHQGVAASALSTRRQLPWYGLFLVIAMAFFGYFIGGTPVAALFAAGLALFGASCSGSALSETRSELPIARDVYRIVYRCDRRIDLHPSY